MTLKIKQQEREKYLFYDGQVELEYDPIDHVYLKDNEPIPSVTTICKIVDKSAVLINWAVKLTVEKILSSVQFPISEEALRTIILEAKNAHRVKLEDAGTVGKQAHAWIESYIKYCLKLAEFVDYPSDERVRNCCKAALSWINDHNVRWIDTERKVYSQVFDFAGTLDGIALVDSCNDSKCCQTEFKDHLSLIDWKSSNQLYNDYLLQTAAYQEAYEEETRKEIIDRWIIRLGKDDGECEAWYLPPETYSDDFLAFELCLELTRAIKSVSLRMKESKKQSKKQKKNRVKIVK